MQYTTAIRAREHNRQIAAFGLIPPALATKGDLMMEKQLANDKETDMTTGERLNISAFISMLPLFVLILINYESENFVTLLFAIFIPLTIILGMSSWYYAEFCIKTIHVILGIVAGYKGDREKKAFRFSLTAAVISAALIFLGFNNSNDVSLVLSTIFLGGLPVFCLALTGLCYGVGVENKTFALKAAIFIDLAIVASSFVMLTADYSGALIPMGPH